MQIGRYTIVEELGTGGMAQLFKVEAAGPEGFKRQFALKRIRPEYASDTEFVRLFVNEARVAAILDHRNIVRVFDLGKEGGELYLVMEFVDGMDLRHAEKLLAERGERFPTTLACYVAGSILRALHYAHTRTDEQGKPLNVIHRDVTPHNVLLAKTGEVKLADFGIAKAAFTTVKTAQGLVRGKLAYMSPEQIQGRPLTQATDIFSTGVLFYEMLTGRLLRAPGRQIVRDILEGRLLDPEQLRQLPSALADLVVHMTAPVPEQRPTARQAIQALAASGWDRDESLALADLLGRLTSQPAVPPRSASGHAHPSPPALREPTPPVGDEPPEPSPAPAADQQPAAPARAPRGHADEARSPRSHRPEGAQHGQSRLRTVLQLLLGLAAGLTTALLVWRILPSQEDNPNRGQPTCRAETPAVVELPPGRAGAILELDGLPLPRWPRRLRVRPGRHVLVFRLRGRVCNRFDLALRPGQPIRLEWPDTCSASPEPAATGRAGQPGPAGPQAP